MRSISRMSRREVLQAGAAVVGAGLGVGLTPPAGVKALVFDTFGTVVDWRTSVAREIEALAKKKGFTVDGEKFAEAWRAGYRPSSTAAIPWREGISWRFRVLGSNARCARRHTSRAPSARRSR